MEKDLDMFLSVRPGLEAILADEARELGLRDVAQEQGGVACRGTWADVWRANLWLRCADRVLVRVAAFRAMHPAQLDKRARKVDWAAFLRPDIAVSVEATCRSSRIYHQGAARDRVARAISEGLGIKVQAEAPVRVSARIVDDLCTISVDTSGELLHKRGHKQGVGKAPLRETMAAAFLRACGYDGSEPVVDLMCGSGTIPIEAAEIATGLAPGRARSFGFELLAGFDAAAWDKVRAGADAGAADLGDLRFYGSDRDQGVVGMAQHNAARAGVAGLVTFERKAFSDAERPDGPPGLVLINPPYGGRIGNRKQLFALYGSFGAVMRDRFAGWRVGLVTNDAGLAKACDLPFDPPGPVVAHGGLKVRLWQTGAL